MKEIYHLLYKIGMRSHYTGYNYLAYAIYLTIWKYKAKRNMNTVFYSEIATMYGTTRSAVESAIRTLLNSYWRHNGDKIIRLHLGFPLYEKPTPRDFIDMLADYLIDHPLY